MTDALFDLLVDETRARLDPLGFELVDMRVGGSRTRRRLQIRIDRVGGTSGAAGGVTVDDCGAVSRLLEEWLDAAAPLGPRYVLEVSSPGLERPVRWLEHWTRFVGQDVRVRLPEVGRVRATIVAVDPAAQTVTLRPAAGTAVTVPVGAAKDATLAIDWESSGLRVK